MLRNEPVQIPIDAHRLSDSIVSDWDSVFTFKFWLPRHHFQARLQLYAIELNCGYPLHIFYENIN